MVCTLFGKRTYRIKKLNAKQFLLPYLIAATGVLCGMPTVGKSLFCNDRLLLLHHFYYLNFL